jgi:hypothetical protein
MDSPVRRVREEYRTMARAGLGGGGLLLRLSAQCFGQLFQELRELAGHHSEVDVERRERSAPALARDRAVC